MLIIVTNIIEPLPSTVLNVLRVLAHLILTVLCEVGTIINQHFTDRKLGTGKLKNISKVTQVGIEATLLI